MSKSVLFGEQRSCRTGVGRGTAAVMRRDGEPVNALAERAWSLTGRSFLFALYGEFENF